MKYSVFIAQIDDQDNVEPQPDENYDDTCSGMSPDLGEGCSISDDCSTVTCKMDFVDKPITFKLKVYILMVLALTVLGTGQGLEKENVVNVIYRQSKPTT